MNENLLQKIDTLRSQIAKLKNELHALKYMPIHPDDVSARVAEVVKELAAGLNERLLGDLVCAPQADDDIFSRACYVSDQPGILHAWIDPAGLTKKLTTLARPHATGTVPMAERPQLQADLERRLFEAETAEEALVVQAEAAGLEIFRRPDIDPAIVLEAAP
jgi:hypothetical protein